MDVGYYLLDHAIFTTNIAYATRATDELSSTARTSGAGWRLQYLYQLLHRCSVPRAPMRTRRQESTDS